MAEIVVTGAGGFLGSVLMRVLHELRRSALGLFHARGPSPRYGASSPIELVDPRSYERRVLHAGATVLVHLSGVTQIGAAYRDPERAHQVNVQATARLLALARRTGARFVYASTDLVFDGEHAPYDEAATPAPLSVYGRTKLEAECHVLAYDRGLVVRLPLLYGEPEAERAPTFFAQMVAALRRGEPVRLFEDETRTPLWVQDAAAACLALADSELTGVVHAGGPERLSRLQMGQAVARALGVSATLAVPIARADLAPSEPRARDVSLRSERYAEALGRAPGRALADALPALLRAGPNRKLD